MATGRKLVLAGLIVAITTAYMAYLGAAESWQYYLTSDECVDNCQALIGKRLRVSGLVATGTLRADNHTPQVAFALKGNNGELPVLYTGTVPDNLSEGIEVVVEGRLDSEGTLQADKLLTKCASKYTSKESSRPGAEPGGARPEPATETES